MAKYLDKSGNVVDETGKIIQTASQYQAAQKAAQSSGIALPKLSAYSGSTSSTSNTSPRTSKQTPQQIAMAEKAAKELGLGSLSEAQAKYNPSPLPSLDEVADTPSIGDVTKSAYNLDLPEKPKSRLVEFADTLSKATDLARKARIEKQTGVLFNYGFEPGKVAPATMANIVGLLDRRSASFVEGRVAAAEEAYKMDYDTRINEQNSIRDLALKLFENGVSQEAINGVLQAPSLDAAISVASGVLKTKEKDGDIRTVGGSIVKITDDGKVEVLHDGSANKLSGTASIQEYEYAKSQGYTGSYTQYQNEDANRKARAAGITPTDPSDKKYSSGSLTVTQGDLGELSQILNGSRGSDGYADPNIYMNAYDKWVSNGGLPADFLSKFPPKQYLNPAIDPAMLGRNIPAFILNEVKPTTGTTNPFAK